MIAGVQFIGFLFGLIMIYLSYVYYRKKSYSGRSFAMWTMVWVCFLVIIVFPETIYGIMQALEIKRTADFIVMIGFFLYAVIIFYLYITVKLTERRVEHIVRALAFERRAVPKKKKVVRRK